MSGNQCSDFGATSVPGINNQPGLLCSIPTDSPVFPGLVTYRDGRVAVISDQSQAANGTLTFRNPTGNGTFTVNGLTQDQITLIRSMQPTDTLQGAEIGDCASRDGQRVSYSFLQNTSGNSSFLGLFNWGGGQPITWGPEHLREIYRLLNQTPGQTGNAFLCSNREDRGRIALNNDGAHIPGIRAAITALENNSGSLDRAHRTALLESLRTAGGVTEQPGHLWPLVGVGVTFTIVGLLTHWLTSRKGPPPSGGGGGGNNANDVTAILAAAVSALAAAGWRPPAGNGGGEATNPNNTTRVAAPEAVTATATSNSSLWLTAGGLLAAGATLFFLRRAGGREVREGEGRLEVRDMAGRLEVAPARPVVRESNAGNGGFNVFDLMGANPQFAH